jgi:hypothetical protein
MAQVSVEQPDMSDNLPFGVKSNPQARHMRIVMPSYTGIPSDACSELLMALQSQGYPLTKISHCSNVEHARTKALAHAMQDAKASEFLLLDDDVYVYPETIERMRNCHCPFVAVVGATKQMPYQITLKQTGHEIVDGLLEVAGAPLHCALIRRQCIEDAWKEFPDRRCRIAGLSVLAIFDSGIYNGELYSEDLWFCMRMMNIGYPLHIMVDADVQHGNMIANIAKNTIYKDILGNTCKGTM